jgi:hypothetical protein
LPSSGVAAAITDGQMETLRVGNETCTCPNVDVHFAAGVAEEQTILLCVGKGRQQLHDFSRFKKKSTNVLAQS